VQILLFGGVAFVGLSFLLPLLPASVIWSSESAEELTQAQQRLQKLIGEGSKAKGASATAKWKAQLAEAEAAVNELQGGLDGAVSRPFWLSIFLCASGAIMVGAGWWLYYVTPEPKEGSAKSLAEMDPDYVPPEPVDVTALDYTKAVRQSRGKHKTH